ncbi:GPR endopeptidase [Feifania hominis]|uniref:Germination protease n=1 Tax=Feifania hominis TaxID=2763660 RepID=A0A926HUH4_9FIRM|nr:GPR endopeptidase [Feifania hominis]MBC8536298.1 GPR endopeptidase [Feifania hominis]
MSKIRTDLALEARELASANAGELPGVSGDTITFENMTVHRVHILNEEGSSRMGKPVGDYITVELPREVAVDPARLKEGVSVISHELAELLGKTDLRSVLVVGLGNESVTPDALGPRTVKYTMVTRHLETEMPEYFEDASLRSVAALAPGVLGQTGVETAEVIKGLCERVKPSAVIVVDALAARRLTRLATTVQLSNTGINPGSGVGNNRAEISEKTLGVPVVAIGVPTVVNAATLTSDVVGIVAENIRRNIKGSSDIFSFLGDYEPDEVHGLVRESLAPFDLDLFVTPKDIDTVILNLSKLVGFSINATLQRGVTIEEMEHFVS